MKFRVRRFRPLRRQQFPGSAVYWEERYAAGANSGAGSYGQTATFKSATLNAFVKAHGVRSVVEFGCGDGHQLSLSEYPTYLGLDVSRTAIELCSRRFADDLSKTFRVHKTGDAAPSADLALSLDVVFHLVEDDVYDAYMCDLFTSASRYVAIFAPDIDRQPPDLHVRYRQFTRWVEAHAREWRLIEHVRNPFKGEESIADFYIYGRAA